MRRGILDKHSLSRGELLHGPGLRRLFALNRDLLLPTLSLVAAYAWFTRAGAREGGSFWLPMPF